MLSTSRLGASLSPVVDLQPSSCAPVYDILPAAPVLTSGVHQEPNMLSQLLISLWAAQEPNLLCIIYRLYIKKLI